MKIRSQQLATLSSLACALALQTGCMTQNEYTGRYDAESLELLEFPQAGAMLRVYTRYFFQSNVGGGRKLDPPPTISPALS